MNEQQPTTPPATEPAPLRRSRWRWGLRWFGRLFLLFVVGTIFYFAANYLSNYLTQRSGEKELNRVRAKLDAEEPGWRFEDLVEKHNAKIGPEPSLNGVLEAESLFKDDLRDWLTNRSSKVLPKLESELASHVDFAELLTIFANSEAAFTRLRNLPNPKSPGFPLVLKENFDDPVAFKDMSRIRFVAAMYQWDIYRAAHLNRPEDSFAILQAFRRKLETFGDANLIIWYLFRSACWNVFTDSIERMISLGCNGTIEQLKELQEFLRQEANTRRMSEIIAWERSYLERQYRLGFTGEKKINLYDHSDVSWWDQWNAEKVLCHFPAATAKGLEWYGTVVAELRRNPELTTFPPASELIIEERVLFNLVTSLKEKFTIENERRHRASCLSMAVALACERFRRDTGAWPKKLDDLVGKYLPALPADPFKPEAPLKYLIDDEFIVVYSVGKDLQDDRGDVKKDGPIAPKDVGARLWNPDQRRRPTPMFIDP